MEQARCWMWTKRKHGFGTHVLASPHPSFGDSWEEQAFAEDAAGPLGGCVWPPRSYSCNFCRREFKSAQALGGHMNVHRRDRARLKQSPNPHGEILPQNHVLNPCKSVDVQYSPQICTFLYNRNSDSDQEVVTSPSSPIRVSAPPTKLDCNDKTLAPRFISPPIHELRKNNMSTAQSWSNLVADKYFHVSDLKNEDKSSKSSESKCRAKGEYVKADLSVSLNLLVCRTHTSASDAGDTPCSKRRRIDASPFTLFPKSSPVERCHSPHSEVLKVSPTSIEDLDLELRLGDPPKVK